MPIKDQVGKGKARKTKEPQFITVRMVGIEELGPIVEFEYEGIKGESQDVVRTAKQDAFEKSIRHAAELTGKPAGPVVKYHHSNGVYRCKVAIG